MKNNTEIKKVVFVGDNHIDHITPANRNDNYMLATLNKLEECLKIAEELKVDAIVFLGDIFESREVGPAARNGALKILKAKQNGDPWPFIKYVVVGNHDIQTSFPLEQSSLGTLIISGVLEKVDYAPGLDIAFAHYTPDLDHRISNSFLTTQPALIWACHASISTVESRHGHVILFEDIPLHPNTFAVISGHIHHPMEMKRSDGKIFVNPGTIGRRSAVKDNFNRDLKIYYLEYDSEGTIYNQEYIILETAEHSSKVFKMEEIEAKKENKKEVTDFIKQVVSLPSTAWSHSGLEDKLTTLKETAKLHNIDDDVINLAIHAVRFVNDPSKDKNAEL